MTKTWITYLPNFIRQKLEGRHDLQKVLGNTGWMIGDQVVRMGVGLVVGVWIARYLGPALFGQLSYAGAIVMLVSPVAMLGLDAIVIRKIVHDPSCRDDVIGTSFFLMVAGGVVAFGLAIAGVYVVRPTDTLTHWLVGILAAGTIFQAFISIEFWFESQLQWKFTVYAKNTAFLFISLIRIGLILMSASLITFAWAGFSEIAIGSAGLVIAYWVNGYRITAWRFNTDTAKKLLNDSWPLIFSTTLTMIYLRIDQIMLGSMAGSEELGVYSAAVRFTEVWNFIPIAICSSVFPVIVKAETTNVELFYEQLQKLYNLMALISYCIAIPVMFLSGWIVKLLLGTAYIKAGPLLAVLIWTGLFTSLGSARTVFIVSKNWTKVNLLSIVLGCILNVVLNYFLIPFYGAMGAVIASCISYWFAVHGTCFIFKPLRKTGWMLTKAMIYPKVW